MSHFNNYTQFKKVCVCASVCVCWGGGAYINQIPGTGIASSYKSPDMSAKN